MTTENYYKRFWGGRVMVNSRWIFDDMEEAIHMFPDLKNKLRSKKSGGKDVLC